MVALPFEVVGTPSPRIPGRDCGEAEATVAPHGAPEADLACRLQPRRAVGGERVVGQQREDMGWADGRIRRYPARPCGRCLSTRVECRFEDGGQCEQG